MSRPRPTPEPTHAADLVAEMLLHVRGRGDNHDTMRDDLEFLREVREPRFISAEARRRFAMAAAITLAFAFAMGSFGAVHVATINDLEATIRSDASVVGFGAPVLLDSDGDGISDISEILGGSDPFDGADPPIFDGKVEIFHHSGHWINVSVSAAAAHIGHGDSFHPIDDPGDGDDPDGNGTDGNETDDPDGNQTGGPDGNGTDGPDGNGTEDPDGNGTDDPDGNETGNATGNSTGNATEPPAPRRSGSAGGYQAPASIGAEAPRAPAILSPAPSPSPSPTSPSSPPAQALGSAQERLPDAAKQNGQLAAMDLTRSGKQGVGRKVAAIMGDDE